MRRSRSRSRGALSSIRPICWGGASRRKRRARNSDARAPLSEHAFGHAFDLQALRLADGAFLTVVGGWNTVGSEKDFWRAFQAHACARFKTVLGPNANKLHYDHLHLDMARRKNGYAICE
mgnify:CR=1 FL=1